MLSPALQSARLDQICERAPEPVRLSGRERELLELAAEGMSSAEIARRPHVLDHGGPGAALEQVAERHARDGGVGVTVEIDADATSAHRQVLFSLGREPIGKAARHANATEIRLRLTRSGDQVTLEVTDDGRGIPRRSPIG